MRIAHLSWEYPPIIYGGLGRHVHALAEAQAAQGHDVVVVTQATAAGAADARVNGVRVIRVPRDAPYVPLDAEHLIAWVLGFNSAVSRAVAALAREWVPQVVHGHDWLVASSLALATQACDAAGVLTMHATEAGRHQGWIPSALSQTIHGVEWWAANRASMVIACSEHMRREITALFGLPPERIRVIPNGVDPQAWHVSAGRRRRMRQRHAGRLIVFTGRLEWEKGVHTLIDAMPRVRRGIPDAHLVIAGRGSARDDLLAKVRSRRLGRQVSFEGWLPERSLHALVAAADIAVVPSIYEPFGIVALEAAAAGTPVVAAASGGLAEIVVDGQTGWLFEPGNAGALADCLTEALADRSAARRRARAGLRRVELEYAWPRIAQLTESAYREAIGFGSPPVRAEADYGTGPALHANLLTTIGQPGGDVEPGQGTAGRHRA